LRAEKEEIEKEKKQEYQEGKEKEFWPDEGSGGEKLLLILIGTGKKR